MMIKINLLPPEKRKKDFPIFRLYIWATYALLVITLLCWAYNLGMFKYKQSQLADIQAQLKSLAVWQGRYDLNQKQNADINKRAMIVKTLNNSRLLWSPFLAELGNITPYGVWLNTITQGAKGNDIEIKGRALKMENILTFVHNLQQDSMFSSVAIGETKTTKAKGNMGVDILDFTLRVVRNGGVAK